MIVRANIHEQFAIDFGYFFINDVDGAIKRVVNSQPYRFCLLNCYNEFKLPMWEKLDKETQDEAWKKSYEWQPLEIDALQRKALAKCIWLLNYVLEKYFV